MNTKLEKTISSLSVYIIAAAIAVFAFAMYFVMPRPSDIDELGLYNPVYMQLHYGHMTYPAYGGGYFHGMFVHPPVRYLEIAEMMRLGLSLPYAEGLSVFLLTLGIIVSTVRARLDILTKMALLGGYFAALVWTEVEDIATKSGAYGLRPDLELALVWFLGLVLLQDAMRRDWNLVLIFIGSAALSYASILHYYGIVAFTGIAYYLIKARLDLPRTRFWHVAVVTSAGCLAILLPYFIGFVLPNLRDILSMAHIVQSVGGWETPFVRHFNQYDFWLTQGRLNGIQGLYYLLYPFLYLKIPLFIFGASVMIARKELRGLGLSALPLPVLVFAYSHGKSGDYYLPELMLAFSAVFLLVGFSLRFIISKLLPDRIDVASFFPGANLRYFSAWLSFI